MKSNISDNFTSTTTKYTEFNDKWSLRCIYLDKLSFYLFYLVTKWNIILTSHFVSGTARTLHCTAADGAEVLRPSYNLPQQSCSRRSVESSAQNKISMKWEQFFNVPISGNYAAWWHGLMRLRPENLSGEPPSKQMKLLLITGQPRPDLPTRNYGCDDISVNVLK